MFRAYLRTFSGEVSEKTNTPDPAAAFAAFERLVNRSDLDGQQFAAALTRSNRQVAFHRFDRRPGDADYWRDKLGLLRTELGLSSLDQIPEYSPEQAAALRQLACWTQAQAAAAVHYGSGNRWGEIERGVQAPDAARWELACIKAGIHPEYGRR